MQLGKGRKGAGDLAGGWHAGTGTAGEALRSPSNTHPMGSREGERMKRGKERKGKKRRGGKEPREHRQGKAAAGRLGHRHPKKPSFWSPKAYRVPGSSFPKLNYYMNSTNTLLSAYLLSQGNGKKLP